MTDKLLFIGDYTLLLNLAALVAYVLLTVRFNRPFWSRKNISFSIFRFTSFTLVMLCVLALDFLHGYIGFKLKPLFWDDKYKDVIGIYWYMSFAVTDLLLVIVVSLVTAKLELLRDRATKSILFVYIFLAFIQLATFFDTWVLNSLFMYSSYPVLIVASNVFVSIVAWCLVFRLILVKSGSPLLFL